MGCCYCEGFKKFTSFRQEGAARKPRCQPCTPLRSFPCSLSLCFSGAGLLGEVVVQVATCGLAKRLTSWDNMATRLGRIDAKSANVFFFFLAVGWKLRLVRSRISSRFRFSSPEWVNSVTPAKYLVILVPFSCMNECNLRVKTNLKIWGRLNSLQPQESHQSPTRLNLYDAFTSSVKSKATTCTVFFFLFFGNICVLAWLLSLVFCHLMFYWSLMTEVYNCLTHLMPGMWSFTLLRWEKSGTLFFSFTPGATCHV